MFLKIGKDIIKFGTTKKYVFIHLNIDSIIYICISLSLQLKNLSLHHGNLNTLCLEIVRLLFDVLFIIFLKNK